VFVVVAVSRSPSLSSRRARGCCRHRVGLVVIGIRVISIVSVTVVVRVVGIVVVVVSRRLWRVVVVFVTLSAVVFVASSAVVFVTPSLSSSRRHRFYRPNPRRCVVVVGVVQLFVLQAMEEVGCRRSVLNYASVNATWAR
jgi:hypothetical protein